MTTPLAYPIKDACAALGISRSRIYELIGAGKLDARKAGRRTVITGESVKKYMATLPKAMMKPPGVDAKAWAELKRVLGY